MNTPCITWCTILTPLSTLRVHYTRYGAELSHLWVPYEYIMHNMVQNCHTSMVQNCHTSEHLMSTSCRIWCRIVTSSEHLMSTSCRIWCRIVTSSEHLMSTSCRIWCRIVTSSEHLMNTSCAECSHLRAPYESIMHRMVQNSQPS